MVFIIYELFWEIQNCCKYLYGKNNPVTNSDFKKPKNYDIQFFWCFECISVF